MKKAGAIHSNRDLRPRSISCKYVRIPGARPPHENGALFERDNLFRTDQETQHSIPPQGGNPCPRAAKLSPTKSGEVARHQQYRHRRGLRAWPRLYAQPCLSGHRPLGLCRLTSSNLLKISAALSRRIQTPQKRDPRLCQHRRLHKSSQAK